MSAEMFFTVLKVWIKQIKRIKLGQRFSAVKNRGYRFFKVFSK